MPPAHRQALPRPKDLNDRKDAAAPPLYLLVVVLIPTCGAIYIASTRFTDYKHAGFDVLFGSLEGLIAAWFAFRLYHLPVRRGAGWAWGPRHRSAAFGIRTGVGSYGVSAHSEGKSRRWNDVDQGSAAEQHTATVELHNLETVGSADRSYESQRALV